MKKNPLSMHIDVDAFIPATAEEKKYLVQMRESSTFFRDGARRLRKNKVAMFSLIVIVIIILSSIFYLCSGPIPMKNSWVSGPANE